MRPEPSAVLPDASLAAGAPPAASEPASGGHGHDEAIELPSAPRPRTGTLVTIGVIGVGLLGGLFLVGIVPKMGRDKALASETSRAARSLPRVNVAQPKRRAASSDLGLPGSVQALKETSIFARTSGYVKRRLVDLGDRVSEGQLLLELETPELRQEQMQAQAKVAEAEAAREQAKTNLEYTRQSLERYKGLLSAGVASQQDIDQRQAAENAARAGVRSAEATINSNQAAVRRLSELQSFARVTAPFSGTVTSRTVEEGALVTAGNGTGQALFKIAQVNPVRLMVGVPQAFAPMVRAGEETKVTVREYANRVFVGKVTRTAGALDPSSRTMLSEVQIPNDDGALLPGMYAQVKFPITKAEPPLLLPTSALLLGAEGTQVAVVGADRRIHLQKVVVEDDYGLEMGIATGLRGDEQVVTNPGERLAEGVEVAVLAAGPSAAGWGGGAAGAAAGAAKGH